MNFKSWLMSHVTSESFYLYFLYSWSYTNTTFCMNGESWGHNAVAYAFLCSSLFAGRILGGVMYQAQGSLRLGFSKHNLNGAFLIMAVLYMGIAIITRYSVLIVLYFMIGLTASRIGVSQNDGYKVSGRQQTHNSVFTASEIDTEVHAKRKIMMFMFSTLLSSLLYNTADASISFPAFYTCSIFSILMLAILLLNTISDRTLLRRICGYFTCRRTVIPRFSQTGISGQNSPSKFQKKHSEESIECSPQDIVVDEAHVPKNFLAMHSNNMTKAKKAFEKSLMWRRDNKVDRILVSHQNHFHDILSLYPHALHRFSIDGCAVAYELLGRAKPSEMKKKGITPEHLTWHFLMRNELLFQKYLHDGVKRSSLELGDSRNHDNIQRENSSSSSSSNNSKIKNTQSPSDIPPMGRMMTVLDVKGVSISDITTDVISFIGQSSEIMDNYYPGRVARLVICNAPSWFHSVWSMVARVLPESVRKKVVIMHGVKGLDEFILPSNRPEEYGGSDVPLGQAPEHLQFLQLAKDWDLMKAERGERCAGSESGSQSGSGSGYYSNKSSRNGSIQGRSRRDSEKESESGHRKKSSKKKKSSSGSSSSSAPSTQRSNRASGGQGLPGSPVDISHHTGCTSNSRNSETFKDNGADSDTAHSRNGSGSSMFGWMRSNQQKQKPSEAFLGEKNSYRYDTATSAWTIDAPEDREGLLSGIGMGGGTGPGTGLATNSADLHEGDDRLNQDEIEEHGLVLAIQAAHLHSIGSKESPLSLPSFTYRNHHTQAIPSNALHSSTGDPYNSQRDPTHGSYDNSRNDDFERDIGPGSRFTGNYSGAGSEGRGVQMGGSKISPHVFLLVISMYFLVCLVDSGIFVLLPIWLTSLRKKGGLGFTVVDVGLSVSSAGMVLLLAVDMFRSRLAYFLKNSPVRGMRIGCTMMIGFCYLLPNFLADKHRSESVLINAVTGLSLRGSGMTQSPFVHDEVQSGAQLYVLSAPHRNPFALIMPSLLLAGIVCASQICRKASAVLLHVALVPSFSSPSTVITATRNFAEIMGPVLFSLILAAVNHLNLRYPMDVSFLLSLSACLSFVLYICTLFLSIQYRGDFGLIADADEIAGDVSALNKPSYDDNSRHTNRRPSDTRSEAVSMTGGILDVPLADMGLLFSSISTSNNNLYNYGTKTHNLGMNLKDV